MIARKPNVLLLVVDSLRRDHLSCYGYNEPTTPNMDELAASSVLFERAISPSGWTLPVFASILTGTYPSKNGVGQYLEQFPTIMEVLRTAAYRSAVVTDNLFVQPLSKQADDLIYVTPELIPKLARSKDISALAGLLGSAFRNKSMMNLRSFAPNYLKNRLTSSWIDRQNGRAPWFVMVHYDVHWPYEPPTTFRNRFVKDNLRGDLETIRRDVYELIAEGNLGDKIGLLTSLYDAQIAWVDACIGDLLEHVRSLRLLDNTMIIVTSDHGDLLGEHDLLHHEFVLYDPLLRVPLIVRLPGATSGTNYSGLVQTVDILPTLIDYLGIEQTNAFNEIQGKSLLKLMSGAERREFTISERTDWSSTTSRRKIDSLEKTYPKFDWRKYAHELTAIRTEDHKYIRSSEGRDELYDLEHDPGENRTLISIERDKAGELGYKLDSWRSSFTRAPIGEDKEFESSITKRLRALGYL